MGISIVEIKNCDLQRHSALQWARGRSKLPPWLPTWGACQGYDHSQLVPIRLIPLVKARARSAGNVASVGGQGSAQLVLCETVQPWTLDTCPHDCGVHINDKKKHLQAQVGKGG